MERFFAIALALALLLPACGGDEDLDFEQFESKHGTIRIPKELLPEVAMPDIPMEVEPADAPDRDDQLEHGIDPKAEEILRRVAAPLRNAQRIQVDVATALHFDIKGESKDELTRHSLTMERPAKIAMRLLEGSGVTVVSDGRTMYVYFAVDRRYIETTAPGSLDQLLAQTSLTPSDSHLLFTLQFLADDPYAALTEGLIRVKYVGVDKRSGVELHHLFFRAPNMTWNMWIEPGDPPIVRRVVPHIPALLYQIRQQARTAEATFDMEITFDNWKLDEPVPADTFTFSPPPGAVKTQPGARASRPGGPPSPQAEQGGAPPSPPSLVGRAAPPLKLDLLDGGTVDIETHRGSETVVLDFWATWCTPCRKSLPALADLCREYAGRGVVLYAINIGDSEKAIESFMGEVGLECPVALDRDGAVAQRYHVAGIPQSIIIDREGIIQAVHEGAAPGLAENIRRELDTLLSGGSVIAGQ